MKKLAWLFACLTACVAQASPEAPDTFTGIYLKGALGASSTKFEITTHNKGTIFFEFENVGERHAVATSPLGLVGLGFLYQFSKPFVLGVDITAGYSHQAIDYASPFSESLFGSFVTINISNEVEAKLTNDFALLLKPGIVLPKNTLLYFFAGPRWGNFETAITTSINAAAGGPPILSNGSDSESGYELGITAGLGLQHRIAQQLHLSLEYAYTSYRNIDSPQVTADITQGGVSIGEVLIDAPNLAASTNTVMLALSYAW